MESEEVPHTDTRTEILMTLTVVASLTYLFGGFSFELPTPPSGASNVAALEEALNAKANPPQVGDPINTTRPGQSATSLQASNPSTTTPTTGAPPPAPIETTESISAQITELEAQLTTLTEANQRDMERFTLECGDWSLPCASVFSEDMNARSRKFADLDRKLKIMNAKYRSLTGS